MNNLSLAKERKLIRKQNRLQHMLSNDCGITSIREPSEYLAILNAGVATGLNEENFLKICQQYGKVIDIVMLPGKSYCFLLLDSVQSAESIYNHVHGGTTLAQGGYPLYLSYVASVPKTGEMDSKDLPEGLSILPDFITNEEEELLLSIINWDDSNLTGGSMKHRRVKHFGYEFLYSNNNINPNSPLKDGIPNECDFMWTRLKSLVNFEIDKPPNQLTVNQYNPGQGIPPHVDTHSAFLSPILSLSLGSSVVMDFKLQNRKCTVLLPARSLLIMDGSSRYEWTHGIAPRMYDLIDGRTKYRQQRTSFTFRWIRPNAKCDCHFTAQCDTYKTEFSQRSSEIDSELASLIEKHHVHQVYDKIASHFNETRSKIWTSVGSFVEALSPDSLLVDVGCGNGKNMGLRDDIIQIGVEYNETLAEVAMYRDNIETLCPWNSKIQVVRADCLALPLRSNCADAMISIAVFHHLATKERRLQAINEVIRVLKPGGQTLITVWAKDQSRGGKTSYLKQDRKNRKSDNTNVDKVDEDIEKEIKDQDGKSLNICLPVHTNRSEFRHQDLLVPWKLKKPSEVDESCDEDTYMRYYHVFEEGELERLCGEIQGIKIIQNFYEQGNWCIILKKL